MFFEVSCNATANSLFWPDRATKGAKKGTADANQDNSHLPEEIARVKLKYTRPSAYRIQKYAFDGADDCANQNCAPR
jgi:hypothetical protein